MMSGVVIYFGINGFVDFYVDWFIVSIIQGQGVWCCWNVDGFRVFVWYNCDIQMMVRVMGNCCIYCCLNGGMGYVLGFCRVDDKVRLCWQVDGRWCSGGGVGSQ